LGHNVLVGGGGKCKVVKGFLRDVDGSIGTMKVGLGDIDSLLFF
jgi:hypothetical protein